VDKATRPTTGLGVAAGVVVAVTYWIGSGRAFGYDAAVTVAHFVRTPSLLDPFRRQVVYNNHVAFSFLEHLMYSVTGDATERTMRVLPILFAAACVGVLVASLAARTQTWIAVTSGALLAANPMFIVTAREPRGYSLLCLCAVASTSLLLRLERRASLPLGAAYVGLLTLGVATHLYMVLVLAGQIVFVAVRGRLSIRWTLLWFAGVLTGGAAYLGIISTMRSTDRGRLLHLAFPRELMVSLTGQATLAIAVVTVGVAIALWRVRRDRAAQALALLYLAVFATLWLVVAPRDLYPRFFVWALPAVALGAATGLAQLRARRVATGAVVLACVAMLWSVSASLTVDEFSNRAVAPVVRAAQARGERVCGLGTSTEALSVYASNVAPVYSAEAMNSCDMLVALTPADDSSLVEQARERYTKVTIVEASTRAVIFSEANGS